MTTAVETEVTQELKEPKFYNVIFLNDDLTPMEFVIIVLMQIFGHDEKAAEAITMAVHENGKGSAGTYSFEIAQQKQYDVLAVAKMEQHPLRVVLEEIE